MIISENTEKEKGDRQNLITWMLSKFHVDVIEVPRGC